MLFLRPLTPFWLLDREFIHPTFKTRSTGVFLKNPHTDQTKLVFDEK